MNVVLISRSYDDLVNIISELREYAVCYESMLCALGFEYSGASE